VGVELFLNFKKQQKKIISGVRLSLFLGVSFLNNI
jgi:hypothetical protein